MTIDERRTTRAGVPGVAFDAEGDLPAAPAAVREAPVIDPAASPYQGYLYAYPHKTAYRPLLPRPALADVWRAEPVEALFLYVHIPFCEMRCGFCNLFTRSNAPGEQVTAYLRQLRRQAEQVAGALGDRAGFARVAFGGGTPTHLSAAELTELFEITTATMGAALPGLPLSVETSPATATPERLAVLNIDLIYGIDGQTAATWAQSLAAALAWAPEELYLYPLYVRPLTGLGRRTHSRDDWDQQRQALYRQAVETLTAAGYRQESMRQFRRAGVPVPDGPDYCCQDDGMVGLGCGARSYTSRLHYSFDYAVSVPQVRVVLEDYLAREAADFGYAEVGFALDDAEQRRRWLLKSLLRAEGVDADAYSRRFLTSVEEDFPQLAELAARGWADGLRLTAAGLARSDAIGPWLVSGPVSRAMAQYVPR